jgi:uncharacterized protein DUF3108
MRLPRPGQRCSPPGWGTDSAAAPDGNVLPERDSKGKVTEPSAMSFADPGPLGDHRRTLLWALLASLLVHLLLLLGSTRIDFGLSPESESPLTLSATLTTPPPVPEPQVTPTRRASKPPRETPRASPHSAPPPHEPTGSTSTTTTTPAPEPEPVKEAPPPVEDLAPLPDIPFARRTPPPAPSAVTLPASADLEYAVFYGNSGFRAGRATHSWRLDGDRYTIRSAVEASGIVSLFYSGQMIHQSEGQLTAQGLRPERYSLQRGTPDRMESASFDWANLRSNMAFSGVTLQSDLLPGTQDQVSFLHQLPFLLAGESPYSLVIATPRKTDSYDVQVVGKETIKTDAGEIPTVHVRRATREDTSSMDVWLAPDLYYLPVKLRLRDNKGNLFQQVLTAANVK